MTIIESLKQDIKSINIDGAMVPRDCFGIIDENAKDTEHFAYHIVDTVVHRTGARAPHGRSWGHMFRHFDAKATTRCGAEIEYGISGEISLLHTTKLCMDCARTVPGIRLTRQFKITAGLDQFSIREVEPSNLVSLDHRDKTVSREGAWQAASIQLAPVVFFGLDGDVKHIGQTFNPERYEKAAYDGYVSAGFMMTDGYYAPVSFESWVATFRKCPNLDEPEQASLRPMLDHYKASLPLRAD